MRGCLLLVVGFVLGISVTAATWPHIPSSQAVPGAAEVRIQVSDAYLSGVVAEHVRALHSVSLQGISVTSNPPTVLVVRASMAVGPVAVPVSLEMQPYAAEGTPVVRVVQAQLAGVPLPALITGIVTRSINNSLHGSLPPGTHVQAIAVTSGGVEIIAR